MSSILFVVFLAIISSTVGILIPFSIPTIFAFFMKSLTVCIVIWLIKFLKMLSEVEFDSEVMSLIEDLSLVLAVSPEGQQWWTCWLQSRFSRYPLCERYKARLAEIDAENHRLMVRLAKKNMRYSRYDIDNDFGIQQKLFK